MNRALQQALFQQTNQGLLEIRHSEVKYYQSLNVAFGTQAALVGGFTYAVFTQNEVNYDNGYLIEDILADVYWITSSITIALSVHVILCTMLLQVLGPGLALNGPLGSMARATEGMRLEQQQIIVAFVGMIFSFSSATVLSCWVVMSFEASVGCSVAFLVAASYWYKYCERIYLRFYWNPDEAGWRRGAGSIDSQSDDDPLSRHIVLTTANAASKSPVNKSMKARKGFFQSLFARKNTKSDDGEGSVERSSFSFGSSAQSMKILQRTVTTNTIDSEAPRGSMLSPSRASLSASRGIVMEGYLTKRGGNAQTFLNLSEPWERRYFTLTNAGNLFIYKNRHEYRTDHKNPIYTRPLRLSDYYVEVNNFDDTLRAESNFGAESSKSENLRKSLLTSITVPDDSEIMPYRFQMTLVLREHVDGGGAQVNDSVVTTRASLSKQSRYRDHWVLRCDTEEELQHWVHAMKELCPSSFESL